MSVKKSNKALSISTILASERYILPDEKPHSLPIFSTSSFEMESLDTSMDLFEGKRKGFVYSRYGNPTVEALEQKLALIESGDNNAAAVMTSSGMAAISSVFFTLLDKEEVCLTHDGLYGGSTEILEMLSNKIGFRLIFCDLNNEDQLKKLQKQHRIKAIYFESPSNPLMKCVPIRQLTRFAQKHGIMTVCDNTVCTPVLQAPLQMGVDYVVYSTTKYLAGHGNSIAGCIISRHTDLINSGIRKTMRLTGGNCSPWEAWLTYNGLRTLVLRMEKQCFNANALASFLARHKKIKAVYHNSLTSHPHHDLATKQMHNYAPLMSFELDGGLKSVRKFMNRLKLIKHAPTLGDLDTLMLHPDTSSHRNIQPEIKMSMGITPGLVRLSTGIEFFKDIKNDIIQALDS